MDDFYDGTRLAIAELATSPRFSGAKLQVLKDELASHTEGVAQLSGAAEVDPAAVTQRLVLDMLTSVPGPAAAPGRRGPEMLEALEQQRAAQHRSDPDEVAQFRRAVLAELRDPGWAGTPDESDRWHRKTAQRVVSTLRRSNPARLAVLADWYDRAVTAMVLSDREPTEQAMRAQEHLLELGALAAEGARVRGFGATPLPAARPAARDRAAAQAVDAARRRRGSTSSGAAEASVSAAGLSNVTTAAVITLM